MPAAIAATLLFPQATGTQQTPFTIEPMGPAAVGVAVANAILGAATIVGVILTWRTGNRIAARIAAARVIAALLTVPVFLLQDMPAWIFTLAAALVILNITTVILLLSRPTAPPLPG